MSFNLQKDDFSICDREPIHIPGSIQPHGFFLGLSADGSTVLQVSNNITAHTGMPVQQALGAALREVLGADNAARLLDAVAEHHVDTRTAFLGTVCLENGRRFDALAHRSAGLLVLELEQAGRPDEDLRYQYSVIGNFLGKLTDANSVEEMSRIAAAEVKRLTGFGRVLVYRFDDNNDGHVVAEERDPEYHSYLHQRFPAADIPRQARELYVANRIRMICDANYVPSQLTPAANPLTGKPNDLTFSVLRSVSPVHVQYMKNMGTMASMSASIIIKDRLWGLISCHNTTPRYAPFESRVACEQIGQILALRIESKEDRDEYGYRLELRRMLVSMLAALGQGDNLHESAARISQDLLRFASASGAALIFENKVSRYGDTPDEQQLTELVKWLSTHVGDELFHTHALQEQYPQAAQMQSIASGVLVLPISRIHRHYLIWFRPEVVQTIDWAGNPHLKEGSGSAPSPLSPRASFQTWHETVSGTSLPWRPSEIEIAAEFRTALLGLVLQRAEEMAELAEELGRANKELEAFSYSVSHDLRAPMRHIVGFADLLQEFDGAKLSERGNRFITNIRESARFAGKLVDDLLSFSQMGRAALRIGQTDMNELVAASIRRLSDETRSRKVEWKVADLPQIQGDPAFLQLAIFNLLANALKYTRPKEQAEISIDFESQSDQVVFRVSDNGVGFPMEYVHKLFGVFQRLHRMEEFEGTGIGLAIVRRVVERHGGQTWAQGAPDQGATFSFSIPKEIPLEDSDRAKTYTPR